MRVLYVDETGHSANQPITIVAGVLLEPDRHRRGLIQMIDQIKGTEVPSSLQRDFIFHAHELHQGSRAFRSWNVASRRSALCRLLALPRSLGLPVVLGLWRRQAGHSSVMSHALAHGFALKAADNVIQQIAAEREHAVLVAEDRPEARRALTEMQRLLLNRELSEQWLGRFADMVAITRIAMPPAFASKADEPVLQVADALAYAMRRFTSNAGADEDYLEALFGRTARPLVLRELIHGPMSYFVFYP